MRSISISLLFLSLLISTALQAATYKWTDETGEIVYSQQPPKSGPYEVIRGLRHSETPSPVDDSEDEANSESSEEETKPDQAGLDAQTKNDNCEAAKKNRDMFKVYKRVRMADGSVKNFSEEERQKEIDEAEAQIRLFCN